MTRKPAPPGPPGFIKTSISLPSHLAEFAEQQMAAEGLNSFSAYIARLIHQAKERLETEMPPIIKSPRGASYPPPRSEIFTAEERPRKKTGT